MEQSETAYHVPVLLKESVDALDVRPDGVYVDVTFGGGGHSREILRRLGSKGRLIAFDQDSDALANRPDDSRFFLVNNNFRYLADYLDFMGVPKVDGVLGDLGVSSHHFDVAERGFSFRQDGPLDMRMNRAGGRTAADVLHTYSTEELARIFGAWGEIDKPYRLASAIDKARGEMQFAYTQELRTLVESACPRGEQAKTLAKVFQALRIEVNHEMDALSQMLSHCAEVLRPGGRLVMIAYHSLEDRMVKNTIKTGDPMKSDAEKDAIFGGDKTPYQTKQRKPLVPSDEEVAANPRSRSAKMRWAVRKKED